MSKFFTEKPEFFTSTIEVSTVFMECEQSLLLLKRTSSSTWGIPGGKLEKNETPTAALIREIWEELQLVAPEENLTFKRSLYVSNPKVDYQLHLYHWHLKEKPSIILNPAEHTDYLWQPIAEFDTVHLLEGQLEAFTYVYPFI
ncbi:MAG: NUDIX hydrolase [Chlamydiales bacterium]|nr:NUDIX hydrolase [Chlamydiales bacterium]